MKKLILFAICLITAVSFVACGDNGDSTVQGGESGQQGTADTNITSSPDKKDENGENNGNNVIGESEKVIISEAVKPANGTLSDSGADYETYLIENISYEEVMNYESKLRKGGFYIQGTSYGYDREADGLKYEITYKFNYKGTAYVTNYDQFEERVAKGEKDYGDLTVTVRARNLDGYNLPELPKENWSIQDGAIKGVVYQKLSTYENCGRETRKNMAMDYVKELKASGYTVNAEEFPNGKEGKYVTGYIPLYYYYAEDENKNSVKVVVSSDENVPTSLVGVTSDEWAQIEVTFKKGE